MANVALLNWTIECLNFKAVHSKLHKNLPNSDKVCLI